MGTKLKSTEKMNFINSGACTVKPPRIAYILSVFPSTTETFILREIEEAKRIGVSIDIFSLKSPKTVADQEGLKELIKSTHYTSYIFSSKTIKSFFYILGTKTALSLNLIHKIIVTHYKNPALLFKTLLLIPKIFTIAVILREKNIDKIHAHWATLPTTAAWIISQINNCEYTFTAHAWDIYKVDTMLEQKIRSAKKVITCTKYNKEYMTNKYPSVNPDKIEVIYHGLNIDRFDPNQSSVNTTFTILSIGRLVQKKGFHILFHALARCIEKGIPFKCNLVYVRGNQEKELFDLYRELQLEDYVDLIPEIPHERVIDYFNNSDCFVLPSIISDSGDRDGIPNVILEAFAAGLPVISTDVSGIPEVVINNVTGLVAEPGNPEDLALKIEQLSSDKKLRATLGQNGRELVSKNFELTQNTKRLLEDVL